MQLKPGMRLRSPLGSVEVVVVKAPPLQPMSVRCDEVEMVAGGDHPVAGPRSVPGAPPPTPDRDADVAVGQRYIDDAHTIELLCTRPGRGPLTVDGSTLRARTARPLPASD